MKKFKSIKLVTNIIMTFSLIIVYIFMCSTNLSVSAHSSIIMEANNAYSKSDENGRTAYYSINMNDYNENSNFKNMRGLYIPNVIIASITPKSTGFDIVIQNKGIDKVSSLTFNLVLKDVNGKKISSKSKSYINLKTGKTTYKWNIKKKSVQERITMSVKWKDGDDGDSFSFYTLRYNFDGGKYGIIKALDGQRHHMPSNSISPLSTYNGPCIRMVTADHKKTASYGSSNSAKNFREKEKKLIKSGKFLAAQKLSTDDVKKRFGSKYNDAITKMVKYTKSLGYNK